MVNNRRVLNFITHAILWLGIAFMVLPLIVALSSSTHTAMSLLQGPIPLLPGHEFWSNYHKVLTQGFAESAGMPIYPMLWNSLLMALGIALGKIALSILSAYALVFFDFRFKNTLFWLIFITLMLPIQVRIFPTFEVAASFHMLNTYWGLTLPLMASATATFLFRQFFMTIPQELFEAARMDGASPWGFFKDILLPLSRTNIAALFIIMFIYGWNQFLWPLVVTTKSDMYTIVMGIQRLADVSTQIPQWNFIMATAVLAMIPPVVIVVIMQKQFVKGLIETEK